MNMSGLENDISVLKKKQYTKQSETHTPVPAWSYPNISITWFENTFIKDLSLGAFRLKTKKEWRIFPSMRPQGWRPEAAALAVHHHAVKLCKSGESPRHSQREDAGGQALWYQNKLSVKKRAWTSVFPSPPTTCVLWVSLFTNGSSPHIQSVFKRRPSLRRGRSWRD